MMKRDSKIMKSSNFEASPALENRQDINRNQCKICYRKFVNKVGLDTHTRQVHHVENNKKFLEKIEENQIVISKDPRNGEKKRVDQNGKPYTCEKCFADFRFKKELYKHAKSAHGVNLQNNWKCQRCDHVTKSPKLLKLHIAKVHEGKNPNICEKCDKAFSTKFKLKAHVQSVHEGQKHVCDTCGKGYIHKDGLRSHINVIHNKLKRKKQKKKEELDAHMRHVDDEDKKWKIQIGHFKVDLKDFQVVQDEKTFIKCFKINCEALLKTSNKIKEHIKTDHNGKPYTCEKCLADFRLKDNLYKHTKSAHGVNLEKNQKCFICDHITTGPKLLELHIAKVHEGKNPFSCEKCDKAFSTNNILKAHIQSVHEGEKHLCETCGKGYTHKDGLRNHIDHIHNKLKRKTQQHLCSICGKDYTQKWALEQHMASIHNEGILDKKYKCNHCDYASVMR